MKALDRRAIAGLFALGGTLFLFLLPLIALHQFFISDYADQGWSWVAITLLVVGSVSVLIGVWFFWRAMQHLLAHSRAVVDARRRAP
jgi:drug/metabolite transporter (DMT)-like permease